MQISCPECHKQLRVPDAALGKTVRCPSCQATFKATAAEQIQTLPSPPAPRPTQPVRSPLTDEDEDQRPRRRPRDDHDDDEEQPPHRRSRDEEDDDLPPRRRREYNLDDDDRRRDDDDADDQDDYDDRRSIRQTARQQGKVAGIFFIAAGILTVLLVMLNISSTLYVESQIGGGAGRGQDAAQNAGRMVGLFGCGLLAVLSAIYQFMASAGLRSFQGKGRVVTAIVFGFFFGILFGIGLLINLALVSRVPPGWLTSLVWMTILLGGLTATANLLAAIMGILALNKPAIARAFRRRS